VNSTVLLVTALLAVGSGGLLVLLDNRAQGRNTLLRSTGVETDATVISSAVRNRKAVIVCSLADGGKINVPVFSETRYRRGQTIRIRMINDGNEPFAELVNEPRRSMGRAIGITLGVSIMLLGLVLAALS
jgi:hypothetical protein